MLRCIIVDDEQHAVDLVASHVSKTPGLELALATTHPQEVVAMVNTGDIDLLFSDVEMPGLSGFDIIKTIPRRIKVIFCTGYKKYALDGYDFNVLDYLLKPVTYARFIQSVQKAITLVETEKKAALTLPKGHLFVQSETRTGRSKINFENIDLIEASGNYLSIVCGKERTLTTMTMKELLDILPQGQFLRVHNSYIVPIQKIRFIDMSSMRLVNLDNPIPLGITYRQKIFEALNIMER